MDENKYRKIYIEWWHIRKSTIATVVAAIIILGGLGYGGWWASQRDWFVNTDVTDVPADAARIVSFEGEVRITRASTRDTILVTKSTWVAAGDTIQTQSDGRAIVQMIDGSTYSVRPNSTVVVKTSTSILGGKSVRVSLDDGQLNVRTDDQPKDTNNIVEVADTENRILPKTDASFNADSSTNGGEIRISRGGVETTIGGEKSVIGEDQFAAVKGGKLSTKEKLLAPPLTVSPGNSSQIVDSGSGVSVTFNWMDAEGNQAASYYLQVSRSPTFASDAMLVDRSGMTNREFRLTGLSPGTYYWRLKSTARSGQTTNWCDAWKFMVVRGESVVIEAAEWKVDRVGGTVYLVSGHTSPGVTVKAMSRSVISGPDGKFQLQIASPSIEAAFEINDDRGNRTGYIISLRNGAVLRRY